MAENTSCWMASLGVALVIWLVAMVLREMVPPSLSFHRSFWMAMPFLLFFVRDGIIVHAIFFDRKRKYPAFMMLVYLLMAYILLPALHGLTFGGTFDKILKSFETGTSQFSYLQWYYPMVPDGVTGLLPVTTEIFALVLAIVWRLRNRKAEGSHLSV